MPIKLKVKKGDKVVVITGRSKGAQGEVLQVMPKENRAVVKGVNVISRHQRPKPGAPGGIIRREAPIHISNLMHVDPKTGEPTRVGFRILEDGRKVRFAKRSGEQIDR